MHINNHHEEGYSAGEGHDPSEEVRHQLMRIVAAILKFHPNQISPHKADILDIVKNGIDDKFHEVCIQLNLSFVSFDKIHFL